jgi:branched-chain amino acid transport system substrate-binding protein
MRQSFVKLGLLAIGMTVALFVGCDRQPAQSSSSSSSAAPAGGSPTDPILIGEYGSMTGAQATFGQQTHEGITLAINQINAAGGVSVGGKGPKRQLKVITYDTRGQAAEASNAVTRLVTDDKVVAVLGEVASSLSLAGAPVAQKYGVPMISPSSTNPKVTQVGDMIFRICFIDPFQGFVTATFARQTLKVSKVAVLYDQSQAYSVGLKDSFVKAFTAQAGTIVTEQAYKGGDQDFNAQLTTIRQTSPQAIYVPGYYTDVGNIAVQARKLGIANDIPLMGGDGWESEKLLEIAGSALDGSFYSNHYANDNTGPEAQRFVADFKAAFKSDPDAMSALGYDAARILADAITRAESLSGKDLAKAIGETRDFLGVTGTITLNAERNADKTAVIIEIKNSKPVYRASVEPSKK